VAAQLDQIERLSADSEPLSINYQQLQSGTNWPKGTNGKRTAKNWLKRFSFPGVMYR